jgi:Domain of unknown function (DUF927)
VSTPKREDNVVSLPLGERPVPGTTNLVYQPGVGVRRRDNGTAKMLLAWCPAVTRHLVTYSPRGEITSRRVTVEVGGVTATVSTKDVADGSVWRDRFPTVAGAAGRDMREALTNIVDDQAGRLPLTPMHPRWEGDRQTGQLVVPPADVLPSGYLVTAGTHADFAALVHATLAAPRIALVMGLSVGGLYVEPLGLQSFVVHLSGRSSAGKTTTANAAGAIFGRPRGVVKRWDVTANGLGAWLRGMSVLTAFRDELGAAKFPLSQLESVVFRATEGAQRDVSDREGRLRESDGSWYGALISTGNESIIERIINEGVAARVIEIHGALTVDAAQADVLDGLTRAGYGHGLPAIAARALSPATFEQWVSEAAASLGLPAGGPARRVGQHLAMGIAGARLLGEVTAVDSLSAVALDAARELLADLVAGLNERGSDPGDRLLGAISGAMASGPALFPTRGEYELALRTSIGPTLPREITGWDLSEDAVTGDVAIIQSRLSAITEDAGIDDPGIALRELRRKGLLLPGSDGRHLARLIKIAGKPRRVYVITGIHSEDIDRADDGSTTPTLTSTTEPPAATPPVAETAPAEAEATAVPAEVTAPVATIADTDEPCEACGRPCRVRFGTVARHIAPCPPALAAPVDQAATPAPRRQRTTQRPRGTVPATDRRPIVGRIKLPDTAPAIPLNTELANFTAIIRADDVDAWPGLDPLPSRETLLDALDLFHRVTDQTQLQAKSAGRMGILTFYRLAAKFGATPDLEKVELPDALAKIRPKMLDPRWINPDRPPVIGGPPVIGLDVNGQFLAASSMELGTGSPRPLGATDARTMLTVDGKFRDIPGYGQLAGPVQGATGILGTLAAGDWLAAPTLRYLADDLSLDVPLADAWMWDDHRKWFSTSYEFWRDARAALLGGQQSAGTPFALAAVKAIPNAFFGGMVSSTQHNMTATLRHDWTHHVKARARVNALRLLRKASVEPIAMAADTAYFLGMDETKGVPIPENRALGKFKVEKVAEVTAAMVAAHKSGRVNKFRDAVNAENRGA